MNMKKIVSLLKRRPGMSFDEFRTHYETQHVPLAMRLFGNEFFYDYRQNFVEIATELETGEEVATADRWDCITEIWFKDGDLERFQNLLAGGSDAATELSNDEEKFIDRSQVVLMIVDELRQIEENRSL
jgi:uncharacterized protein (TIGR02118 family)